MSLYETMFSQFDVTTSQLLVTAFDFTSPERRRNVQYVISQLLALGIVPLLNENDAVSANQGYQTFGNSFSDNDSLASLVAIEMGAQLLILLTDVKGVYDRPPSDPESKLIDVFNCDKTTFKVCLLRVSVFDSSSHSLCVSLCVRRHLRLIVCLSAYRPVYLIRCRCVSIFITLVF